MKDYYGDLIRLAANGDPRAVAFTANEFGREIKHEIGELEQQFKYVMQMRDYLVTKVTDQTDIEAMQEEGIGEDLKEIPRSGRSMAIKTAAVTLAMRGDRTLSTQMVQNFLGKGGWFLGVQQPNAVIGTVLSSLSEFKRNDTNEFEFVDG